MKEDVKRSFGRDIEDLTEKAKHTVKGGRLLSVFFTRLEEAQLWLDKAIEQDGLIEHVEDGS